MFSLPRRLESRAGCRLCGTFHFGSDPFLYYYIDSPSYYWYHSINRQTSIHLTSFPVNCRLSFIWKALTCNSICILARWQERSSCAHLLCFDCDDRRERVEEVKGHGVLLRERCAEWRASSRAKQTSSWKENGGERKSMRASGCSEQSSIGRRTTRSLLESVLHPLNLARIRSCFSFFSPCFQQSDFWK